MDTQNRLKRKFKNTETLLSVVNNELIKMAKSRINEGILIIDTHDYAYYGKSQSYLMGTKKEKGTNKCLRIISFMMMNREYKAYVSFYPVTVFKDQTRILQEIIPLLAEKFKIELVLIDRLF